MVMYAHRCITCGMVHKLRASANEFAIIGCVIKLTSDVNKLFVAMLRILKYE